ncbi:hypothetical protein Tsubulata_003459 [Turnera subulata]|uniref:Prolamin-like domain-containing protein n=1 Tax=Turnera subulata TaxID=218843 RepID=A0A9Q0G710_9ROSI|nr:hypothetical protein Tsubulata_003459 [Turnera subulata]
MAKFNNSVALLALFLLAATGSGKEFITEDMAPSPLDGEAIFLEECKYLVGHECGIKIFQAIFMGKIAHIPSCCAKLIVAGQACNDDLLENLFETSNVKTVYPNVDLITARRRSTQFFNKCYSLEGYAFAPSA